MNRKRLLPQLIGLTLVLLLSTACGTPQSSPSSTSAPPTLTPPPPPPPRPATRDLDNLWVDCAGYSEDKERVRACDDLHNQAYSMYNKNPHPSQQYLLEYARFGSSCGGRLELFREGDTCTRSMKLNADAPPSGLPVLPWDSQSVRTLCLEIDESYDNVKTGTTPLEKDFKGVLSGPPRYFAIVEDGCDATFTVWARGFPIWQGYDMGGFYSGAEVSGWMSLKKSGFPELRQTLDGRVEPPSAVSWTGDKRPYTEPGDAPFWCAVAPQVGRGFAQWFGPEYQTSDCR